MRGEARESLSGLIIHMSSTGNAKKLSAVSRQLSVERLCLRSVAMQRGQECPRHTDCPRHTSKLAGFFFFGGVAGKETFDEVSVRFPGAKFGVGQNLAVQRNCGVDAFYDEHLERA
jgi:hypothetical protein